MALFEAIHLQKRFGNQVVLEDINLSFEEGKLSGIMGPNGAGKTTCFNVLTGLHKPDRGTVRFAEEEITGLAPYEIARKGISRSFQMMNLFNDYSVSDNIIIGLPEVQRKSFNGWHNLNNDKTSQEKAASTLEKIGLLPKAHVLARNLSYGERRALEIGVALASEPRLLFLDEPTAGLGAEGTAHLIKLITELKNHITMVVIEHDMNFLFTLADKISVIHWGQVIAQGTPGELRNNPWVLRSSVGASNA
jgi:branched-chain amino acid transport system ATP-binding protein